MNALVGTLAAAMMQAGPIAAPPPSISASPAHVAPTPAAQVLGREIATLLNSREITLSQTSRMFDETMPKVLAANADYQVIEKAYPGYTAAILTAMRPEIERDLAERLPVLWARLGGVYADAMSEGEMRDALAFYRTPTGSWLIAQVVAGSDPTALIQRSIADPDAKVGANDLRDAITKPAISRLSKDMTPERAKDILRFGATSAGQKLRAANPRLLEAAAGWSNEMSAQSGKRLEATVLQAAKQFIEKADKAEKAGSGKPARHAVGKDDV